MLKIDGARVESDAEVADMEERQHLPEEVRIPDFFDHWMEEYAYKIVTDPSHRTD